MYSSENNVTGHILGNLAKDGKDCNRVWTRLEVSAPAIAGASEAHLSLPQRWAICLFCF